MSDHETACSEIHRTLDAVKAPAAPTIPGRIRGLVGRAAAELHEAGFVVGDGSLAEAIAATLAEVTAARRTLTSYAGESGTLADIALRMVNLRDEAIAQRDEQVLIRGRAQQAEADALEALGAERHRADVAEHDARIATTAFGEMAADLAAQRAEVARLSAQLDYASEQLQAALRRGA